MRRDTLVGGRRVHPVADISNIDGVKFTRPVPTRDEVARLLLEQGPATAAALGERLGISPTAVRRHLDALVADGLATDREQRPLGGAQRGRGRPPREFLLTARGPGQLPARVRRPGRGARCASWPRPAASRRWPSSPPGGSPPSRSGTAPRSAPPTEKVEALAEALTSEGYAASAHSVGSGGQLCQHHCPVAHVAAEFPQLCEAETKAFARLLGTHVQRLATIARGDGVCTTHIPEHRYRRFRGRTRA